MKAFRKFLSWLALAIFLEFVFALIGLVASSGFHASYQCGDIDVGATCGFVQQLVSRFFMLNGTFLWPAVAGALALVLVKIGRDGLKTD